MTDTRARLAAVAILAVVAGASMVASLFGWWLFLRLIVWLFGPIQ